MFVDTLLYSLLLLPFAFFWCCCGCGSGSFTDDFSSLNSLWEFWTGAGSFAINSGRMELTSTGNYGIKRCRNSPASPSVVSASVYRWNTTPTTVGNQYFHFRTSDYSDGGFGFLENIKYRITISGSFISTPRYVVQYENLVDGTGNEGPTNISTTPADGDQIEIEVTDIGSSQIDIDFKLNGSSIFTMTSKPWVWQNRVYLVLQQGIKTAGTVKTQWDDLAYTE